MTTTKVKLEVKTVREGEQVDVEGKKKFANRFVSTAPLKSAAEKFFGKAADTEWDNIPKRHSPEADPKVLRAIQKLQQTETEMKRLLQILHEKPDRKGIKTILER